MMHGLGVREEQRGEEEREEERGEKRRGTEQRRKEGCFKLLLTMNMKIENSTVHSFLFELFLSVSFSLSLSLSLSALF